MPKPKRRILIVEDDPDSMKLMSYMLTEGGYDVVRAYGGADALRRLQTQTIDLVLTDLAMPHMNGVELIAAIKSAPETRAIPVIAVTAFVWDQIARSAGQAGCDGYLQKPLNKKELLRELAKHFSE